MGRGGGSGGRKEWSDSGGILKMEPTQLGLDVRSEKKKRNQGGLDLSN